MTNTEPNIELGAFSSKDAEATPWLSALTAISQAELFWLSTVRPDGRPHVTPLLAAWTLDGLCFPTGDQERKARNLDDNPRCVLTTGANTLTGMDVVIEGAAALVIERTERERAVEDFERKYGEHLTSPEGTWYRMGEAIIAGDVSLYRVAPAVGFAFGKGRTYSQTRYTWSAATAG